MGFGPPQAGLRTPPGTFGTCSRLALRMSRSGILEFASDLMSLLLCGYWATHFSGQSRSLPDIRLLWICALALTLRCIDQARKMELCPSNHSIAMTLLGSGIACVCVGASRHRDESRTGSPWEVRNEANLGTRYWEVRNEATLGTRYWPRSI